METRGFMNRIGHSSNNMETKEKMLDPPFLSPIYFIPLLIVLFILCFLFLPTTAKAETWYVEKDADHGGNGTLGSPYNTIVQGLKNASEGDKVLVGPGLYNETFTIRSSITMEGSGPETCYIDAGGTASVISITADRVNISGFSVYNSSIPGAGVEMTCRDSKLQDMNCSWNEYGIYVRNGHANSIINVSCFGNILAGILLDEGSSNNSIIGGQCQGNQRGIYIGGNNNTLDGVACLSNSGDGCRLKNSWNNTLRNMICSQNGENGCYLLECNSIQIEGGLYSENGVNGISIMDCHSCSLNSSEASINEFGLHLENASEICVENSQFSLNRVNIRFLAKSYHNNVNSSHIEYSTDYGIWVSSSHVNSFIGNTLKRNRIGIFLDYSSLWNVARYNNFLNNSEFAVHCEFNNGISVNAVDNFWGHESGPHHNEKNPDGTGELVSDHVEFDPWFMVHYFEEVDTGRLEGYIKTTKQLPIMGASITISCFDTSQTVISDDDGFYELSGLLRGTHYHELSVKYTGYRTYRDKIRIQDDLILDITLIPLNQLPRVVVLTPGNGSEVKGYITLGGSVLDPDSENITVEMRYPDGIWIRIANESNWEFSFETRDHDDGEMVVMFRAYDGENHSEITRHHLYIRNEEDDPGFERPSTFSLIIGFLMIVIVLFVAVMIDHFIFGNRKDIYRALGIEKMKKGRSENDQVDLIRETVPIDPGEESFKPTKNPDLSSLDQGEMGVEGGTVGTRFMFYRGDEEYPEDLENGEEDHLKDYDDDEFKGIRGKDDFYDHDEKEKTIDQESKEKREGSGKEAGLEGYGTKVEKEEETDNDSYKPPRTM